MNELERRNEAAALRWFDEVWNQRREETIDELWAPGAVGHVEGAPSITMLEFKDVRRELLTAFPDFHVEVISVIARDREVVLHWRLMGTHDGPGFGLRPTGKSIEEQGMTRFIFENGQVVEGWDSWNMGAMLNGLATFTVSEIAERHGLTARQAEVAQLLAERRTYKEIAKALQIRPNTARRHCQAVLSRLGLHRKEDVAEVLFGRADGDTTAA
jgi:DNA-binding CsgD family transcriptional regulator/predicted ester cyclase